MNVKILVVTQVIFSYSYTQGKGWVQAFMDTVPYLSVYVCMFVCTHPREQKFEVVKVRIEAK